MSTDRIWFTNKITQIEKSNLRKGLHVVRLHERNYRLWIPVIKQSINNFNSEHTWNDMWSIKDAIIRFKENIFLYLLMGNNNKPLGHVWVDKNYIYNVFVSSKRVNGDSERFLQYIMYDMRRYTEDDIVLYVDSWNERAIGFFKKLNFVKSSKNFQNVMNSFIEQEKL